MKDFIDKFQILDLHIMTVGSWTISLRPEQITIGSMILSLNRKCPSMGMLTKEEGEDLSQAFKEIELLLSRTFKPEKINYLALMMVDHQVHFHVIPRYSRSIDFNGKVFSDGNWPTPPNLSQSIFLDNHDISTLTKHLKSHDK